MMHFAKVASILGFQNMFHKEAPLEVHEKFTAHMEAEGLSYGTREEYEFRFELYQQMDAYITETNQKGNSWTVGHNMFSTMTEAEAKKWVGTIPQEMNAEPTMFEEGENGATVDWRTQGGVNAVKNQGGCGSCWAFGATAGTEHAHWRSSRSLLNLSEQQLVDCSPYDHGCNGGFHTNAWTYL